MSLLALERTADSFDELLQHGVSVRGLLEHVSCGIVVADAAGKILYANPAARRALRLSDEPRTKAHRMALAAWPRFHRALHGEIVGQSYRLVGGVADVGLVRWC